VTHLSCEQERDKPVSVCPGDEQAHGVCVIIAAYNAEATIGRAVRSALEQAPVREVFVVDDASSDQTVAAAQAADDASGRLKILHLTQNVGPSAARNRTIEASVSPLIALLDADDFFLPRRFEAMFAVDDWDLIADNIAFVDDEMLAEFSENKIASFEKSSWDMSLADFIEGNLTKPGKQRAELGFLKPVIRRKSLTDHRLRYDESLRLGEDFALYTQLLKAGARFTCIRPCGYVAVVRSNSLSGSHRTSDLEALLRFDTKLSKTLMPDAGSRNALSRHRSQLRAKHHLRLVLDYRRQHGRVRAVLKTLQMPRLLPGLAASVIRDKLTRQRPTGPATEVRYLF